MDSSSTISLAQTSTGQGNLAAPNGRRKSKSSIAMNSASSANSIASSDAAHDSSSGLRSSLDGAVDRLKGRKSEEGQSKASGERRRRMSKLFKSRRRRKSASEDEPSQLDANEGVPPLPDSARLLRMDQPSPSEESLGIARSVSSSQVTEDSDAEAPPVRPSLSPHASHAGYLTLSSPLIAAETVESPPSTATLADSTAFDTDPLAPKHADTLDVGSSINRSPSPVGKLKEAFSPTRRSTSPKTGGDSGSAKSGTGGGIGGFLGGVGKRPGSRGGAKVLEESLPIQNSPTQLHNSSEIQSTPALTASPKPIITKIPATPPNVVEAPQTFVTPPTPTDPRPGSPKIPTSAPKPDPKHQSSQSNPNIVTSPSGNMISHRRARSATNPASKLSNVISAPLTPTIEETKTPGGSLVSPNSGGFFSSVFSAAQNAATQLSSTIANTSINTGGKGKGSKESAEEEKTGQAGGEEVIGPESADATTETAGEQRELAVETLGSGNLSLAHLGLSESTDVSPMSSKDNLASDQTAARPEDVAAAQAVSAAYAAEQPAPRTVADRPRSLTTNSNLSGATSPPRQLNETDSPSQTIQRSGSIRSRISEKRKRRHRGSSATTGNTISAIIGSSTTTLANPSAQNGSSRLNGTGFAVASPKRNRDFHNLFRSVPEDDYLIEDYSAALQKEILLHGRLYVSEGHLCFSSNILGWVTNLVISFDEVVSVEKKSTAVVFPNAIVIQTLHARNIFASFLSRDSTYDLIIGIWKISHPNLKSSINGVTLDGGAGTGDKTEKAESLVSEEASDDGSDDEVYDEDEEEEEGLGSFTEAGEGSVAGSEIESVVKAEVRKASATAMGAPVNGGSTKVIDNAEAAVNGAAASQDFPGATIHEPTDCGDAASHYDKLLIDTTIPAPLGKIYSLMFGPASGVFMRKWLVDDQKCTELQLEDDKQGLGENKKTLSYSYIKPLGGSIGPRQTKCNIDATLEQFDLEKSVSVSCSTQTPDVPSGNAFATKTRYCLCWGPGNSTRLIMTFTVEWTGKSWLKGPIEKGANDGQISYAKDISAALNAAVSAKAKPKTIPGKVRGKGRKAKQATEGDSTPTTITSTTQLTKKAETNWGLFEPIHGPLKPLVNLLESQSTIIISILLLSTLYLYFRQPTPFPHGHGSLGIPGMPTSQRIAAYEEIWRSEESELWKWLEDRVAMDRAVSGGLYSSEKDEEAWRRKMREREVQGRLYEGEKVGGMSERQMDEAIRVTQERLDTLRGAVERKKGGSGSGSGEGSV